MIRLDEINEDNWRLPLEVAENQKTFVAPPASILARAYAYRHSRSMAYVIYADDTPVGMAMYHDCDPLDASISASFSSTRAISAKATAAPLSGRSSS